MKAHSTMTTVSFGSKCLVTDYALQYLNEYCTLKQQLTEDSLTVSAYATKKGIRHICELIQRKRKFAHTMVVGQMVG